MATTGLDINNAPTSNEYLNTLIWGGKWSEASQTGPVTITYVLQEGDDPYEYAPDGSTMSWEAMDVSAIEAAFAAWEAVANVEFTDFGATDPEEEANIWYWLVSDAGMEGDLGFHEVPGVDVEPLYGQFNGEFDAWTSTGLAPGGYGFITLLHEIGHGLGLAHPHDGGDDDDPFQGVSLGDPYDSGLNKQNQGIFTTMTYNDGWIDQYPNFYDFPDEYDFGWQMGPMAFDIAAVQFLYGANTSYNPTDMYVLPGADVAGTGWKCIWDTGGVDTLSAGGVSAAATINLNAAPLTGVNAGGYVSWVQGIHGGFTIANGVIIENAIGGDGNDSITGNGFNNILTGGSGSDKLVGGAGVDRLGGGAGADNLFGGSGADVLTGGTGADKFVFDAALLTADTLKDFRTANGDKIVLDDDIFTAIGATVASNEFKAGATIKAAGGNGINKFLLYDTDTGKLYYDADANGTAAAPVRIATLTNTDGSHPSLSSTDFLVVA